VAYCYGPSVGLSVTVVSRAKMVEPIEMQFAFRTQVDPRNHILDGVPDPPMGSGNFERGGAHCKV